MSDYFPELTDADCGPLFRTSDPVTSKIAGTMAREFKGDHERRILEALAAGPGTKDEIASRCGLTEQQVARRMHGLARAGLVEATGTIRPSASGRPERVYRATAASA
jgi:predicted ArsR family transcriptional regulator